MSSLHTQRIEAIRNLEKKAEEHYQANDDALAAECYEKAAHMWNLHAQKSLSPKIEQARKRNAMALLEKAKALRSGELPTASAAEATPATSSRGGSERSQQRPRPGAGGSTSPGTKNKDGEEIDGVVAGLLHHSSITWEQIGGLSNTKQEIKYALGVSQAKMPAARPGMPALRLASWRNMLFYGPPGTGKTLLAAATSRALQSQDRDHSVFFNVKVSSVMSKYFGESTKIISELYGKARELQPAVVFLDEFESLCGSRGEGNTGTERRILSTILSELDGLSEKGRDDIFVLTIAATNRPWDLDPAVLSRFDKKILIPLPDPVTREAILEIHFTNHGFELEDDFDLGDLVEITDGLSGRELESLVKEVTNRMVYEENKAIADEVDKGLHAVRDYQIRVRPLTREDFTRARSKVQPVTSPEDMKRYVDWQNATED